MLLKMDLAIYCMLQCPGLDRTNAFSNSSDPQCIHLRSIPTGCTIYDDLINSPDNSSDLLGDLVGADRLVEVDESKVLQIGELF